MTKNEVQTAMHAAGFTKGQRDNPHTRERCSRLIQQIRNTVLEEAANRCELFGETLEIDTGSCYSEEIRSMKT